MAKTLNWIGFIILTSIISTFFCNWLFRGHLYPLTPYTVTTADIEQAKETRSKMNNSSIAMQDMFLDYEMAIDDYLKNRNDKTKEKILALSEKINLNFAESSSLYGLKREKLTRLFKIWNYNFLKTLFNPSQNTDFSYWKGPLLHFETKINSLQDKEKDDYDISLTDLLLYGDFGIKAPTLGMKEKILSNLDEKAIKQETELLQSEKGNPHHLSCADIMSPQGSIDNKEYVARRIANIEYLSRYCPGLIQSKTKDMCNSIKFIPAIRKEAIEEQLAFCEIANERLAKETADAKEKYGELSFETYFEKYVRPLVPNIISNIKNNKTQYCMLETMPIVNFRDPEVDAQLTAYLEIGPKFCDDFYHKNEHDS